MVVCFCTCKIINAKDFKMLSFPLKKTWHLLVEVGFGKASACEGWSGGRRVIWNPLESCTIRGELRSQEEGPWPVSHARPYMALFSRVQIFACSSSYRWNYCVSKHRILLCSNCSLIYRLHNFKQVLKQNGLCTVVNLHLLLLFSLNAYIPHQFGQ